MRLRLLRRNRDHPATADKPVALMPEKKFIFDFHRAPGDVLMLTALVRDLKLTYGDRYLVDTTAKYPGLWYNNPYLDKESFRGPVQKLDFYKDKKVAADR